MINQVKIKNLKKIATKHKLDLLVLFGSYAKNTQSKYSDLDFAFYSKEKITEEKYFNLKKEIYFLFDEKSIDLIDLNEKDDPILRYEILKNGKCFYEIEMNTFDNFQTNAWFNYLYYRPQIEKDNKLLKESLIEI